MSDVELDYEYLTQRALRRVLKDVLDVTADLGETPGDHHFYIEFLTGASGVSIPAALKETYPERMTIVLQHQFANLVVEEEGFSVTLWFKGAESPLVIPFEAVTSFADPSVQFGLRFAEPGVEPEAAADAAVASPPEETGETPGTADDENADSGAQVVNLDAFRKK